MNIEVLQIIYRESGRVSASYLKAVFFKIGLKEAKP